MPTGPSAPAGAIIGPPVKAGTDGDKWNPYSEEGRISQAPFGAEPPWQDPLAPYGPALASIGVSFIPGLNSYMVLNDPEASTAGKVLAVGSDVLSVVGVGTVLKLGAKGIVLAKGVVLGGKVVEGVVVAEDVVAQLGGSYGSVRRIATKMGIGGQVHHMPSWAATSGAGVEGVTRWSAPSIWMESVDHYNTLSHGGSAASPGYRATQEMLIRNGQRLDAMKMDVDSIRAIFGSKYDAAIQQMGEYVWKLHE